MKRQDSDWRQLGLLLVLVFVLLVSSTISLASRPIPPRMNKPNNAKLNSNWQIPYTINNGKLVLGSGWQQGSLIPARNSLLKTIPTGQPADKCDRIIWNKLTRTPRFFKGHLNPSTYQYKVNSANRDDQGLSQQILTTIRENQHYFALSEPDKDLQLASIKESDERIHVKYSQFFQGLPVFNHQLIFHCSKQGDILSYLGDYIHPDQLVNAVVDQPIALDQATMAIRQDLQIPISQLINLQHDFISAGLLQPERGIWIDYNGGPHDAWRINVMPKVDENWIYYIDSSDGKILFKHNTVTHDGPTTGTGYDIFGNYHNLDVFLQSGIYYLLDASKPMSDLQATFTKGIPIGQIITIDYNDTNFQPVTSAQSVFSDSIACSAHHSMSVIYDYFYNTFSQKSFLDYLGGTMISVVHFTNDINNAFWNGSVCTFGDGDGYQSAPLAGALDIVAHEFTHGLTQYNANLIYLNQSGALNEFFSDFFACMIDRDDWLIGEDVWTPHIPGDALRDMSNPPAYALPDNMSEYLDWPLDWDNGGVHYNCGIPSKAAYGIASALGREKAERIFFNVLSNYLVPSSDFLDLRLTCIEVAEILYGQNSMEALAVEYAFNQVGITADMDNAPYFSEVMEEVKGEEWIVYIRPDSLIGIIREDLSEGYYFPSVKALYTENEKTQLSSTRDGHLLCFISDNHKLTLYEFGDPNSLTYKSMELDGYLYEEGDLHTAVIANDGSQFILTSEWMYDNNIYVLTEEGITAYPQRKAAMDGENEYSEPIFIDVADWAPDNKVIIYGAVFESSVVDESSYYWDISQFVLENQLNMTLLPPAGEGVQFGYPKFSSNSPYMIAYNSVDEDKADLLVGNLLTQEFSGLVINGIKPSFSPNDQKLVFQSYNKVLYTCNSTDENTAITNLGVDGENPEWIVITEGVVPVELAIFTAESSEGNVVLKWQTASETNNYGFEVYRAPLSNGEVDWQTLGFVAGNGTTSEPQTYSFVDKKPSPGIWQYRLKQLDTNGDFSFSDVVTVQVNIPQKFVLYPNYPNPFNATTQISFNLPTDEHVRLDVFNVRGVLIATLFNQEMTAGYHSAEFSCDEQASGVFFYKIVAGDNIQVGKALLVK